MQTTSRVNQRYELYWNLLDAGIEKRDIPNSHKFSQKFIRWIVKKSFSRKRKT